jgi:hypothetical protein
LVEDATAGDPITGLKWTRKTSRKLSRALKRRGFKVGPDTVRRLLEQQDYVLRANRKRLNQKQDPDRDRQMRYVARQRRAYLSAGFPVISVDAKQRELIGNFKNPGRTWRDRPLAVQESDYPSQAEGVAIPYGIYDLRRNIGFVVVGTSHQTPAFAIAALRTWWLQSGRFHYADKKRVLVEADCGGANGNRCWLWKFGLQQLANEFGLTFLITHLPTSASKWNPIEHKLFCHIESNWAGQPLVSYETVLKFIRTTRTETGLRCRAQLDRSDYPTGQKITTEQKADINLQRRRVLPRWNYVIAPHKPTRETAK